MEEFCKKPSIRFSGFNDDWEQRKFGDFYFLKNGLNKSKEFFGQGTPIINFTDVFHNREINFTDLDGKVTLTKKEISLYEVKEGDIFFTRTSEILEEIGMPSVMMDEPVNTVFSGFVLRARSIDFDPLHNSFKKYVFITNAFRSEMMKKSSMSTRALTSGTSIREMWFEYPQSFEEQEMIGASITNIDNTITLHQRKLKEIESLKKTLLNKLFPNNGKKIPDYRFTGFTEDWEQRKLKDIYKIVSEKGSSDYEFITVLFDKTVYRSDSHQGYGNSRDDTAKRSAKLIRKGDFLIDLTSYSRGFFQSDRDGLTSSAYTVIRNFEYINYNYWKEFYTTHNFVESLKKFTPPGARQGKMIEVKKVMDLKYPIAKLEEQEMIGLFFDHINNTITLHRRKTEQLELLKKYLLKNMFV